MDMEIIKISSLTRVRTPDHPFRSYLLPGCKLQSQLSFPEAELSYVTVKLLSVDK